jgi:hypothetical protein
MNLQAFIGKIDNAISKLEKQAPRINLKQAAAAKAMVQERVQERGENATGGSFGNYSTKPLPTYFFEDSGTAAARKAIKAKKYKDGVSYDEWRKLNGLNNPFVNFTFTGSMFRNIGVVQTGTRGRNVYTAKIAGKSQETNDKIEWNTKKKGAFMALSNKEVSDIKKEYKVDIVRIIKASFA